MILEEILEVGAHRPVAHAKSLRDLFIGQPRGGQVQNLRLTWRYARTIATPRELVADVVTLTTVRQGPITRCLCVPRIRYHARCTIRWYVRGTSSLTGWVGELNVGPVDNVTTVGGQSAISAPISSEQQRWLAALYEANFAAVSRRCGAILRSGDEAADAVHEVFLIALNSLAPDTEAKRARAWLLTVAQNHCVDVLRRQQRFGRALVKLGADRDARGDLEAGVVDRDFVDGLLRQLSLRERLALWQSAVEHRSLADIATGLQLSYAAAAQVVHRARRHALRLGAGIAAILVVLRPARVVRRVLERMTDGQSLLAAHRAIALAALPVVAALSMQSSTATGTAQPPAPAVATAATLVNSGGLPAPAGLGALLAPLNGASDQLAAGTAGMTPSAGIPSAGIPSVATPTLKSLVDRVAQSTSQVASSIPPVPAAPLPPVPSLPPIGH